MKMHYLLFLLAVMSICIPMACSAVTISSSGCSGSADCPYFWSGSTVTITEPGEYTFAADVTDGISVSVSSSGVILDGSGVMLHQIGGKDDLDLKNITIHIDDPTFLGSAITECRNIVDSSIIITNSSEARGIQTLYGTLDNTTSIIVTSLTGSAYGVASLSSGGEVSGGEFTVTSAGSAYGVGTVSGAVSGGVFTVKSTSAGSASGVGSAGSVLSDGGEVSGGVFTVTSTGTGPASGINSVNANGVVSGGEFTVISTGNDASGVGTVSGVVSGGEFTVISAGNEASGVDSVGSVVIGGIVFSGVVSGGEFTVTSLTGLASGVGSVSDDGEVSGGEFTVTSLTDSVFGVWHVSSGGEVSGGVFTIKSTHSASGVSFLFGVVSGGEFTVNGSNASGVAGVFGVVSGGEFTVNGSNASGVAGVSDDGVVSGGEFTVNGSNASGVGTVSGVVSGGEFTVNGSNASGVGDVSDDGIVSGGTFWAIGATQAYGIFSVSSQNAVTGGTIHAWAPTEETSTAIGDPKLTDGTYIPQYPFTFNDREYKRDVTEYAINDAILREIYGNVPTLTPICDPACEDGYTCENGTCVTDYVPGELIVWFDEPQAELSAQAMEQIYTTAHAKIGAKQIKTLVSLGHPELQLVQIPAGISVEQAVQDYLSIGGVKYAEPNYIVELQKTPNDPDYGFLWGMDAIMASSAWDCTTGTKEVIVAVVDTGVDYTHEDLKENMWHNPGEIPNNGIDDDGNGYIDDYYGWNFGNNDANPMDNRIFGHGTHVAGTIGAVGDNGVGVTGVNWSISIMAVSGNGGLFDGISGIIYASNMGADVINNSWRAPSPSHALEEAVRISPALVVFASGNEHLNLDIKPNSNVINAPNVILVAASDENGDPASFTNYGKNTVHVAAPGVNIYSTVPNNNYASYNGTSMAAPMVSGLAALIKAANPSLRAAEIKNVIMETVTPVPQWSDLVITGGIINAADAIANVCPDPKTNYTITPLPVVNGSIVPSTPQTVSQGESIAFTILPAENFILSQILVDGNQVQPKTLDPITYEFTDVTADHEIEATFKEISTTTYKITPKIGEGDLRRFHR